MWDHGTEINKVCMNFLRQILGVHKKTSNIALMTETGKYPTIMKVFLHIYINTGKDLRVVLTLSLLTHTK